MYNIWAADAAVPIDDLLKDGNGLTLSQCFLHLDTLGKIAAFTEFSDDASMPFELVYVVYLNDVGQLAEEFENFDLVLQEHAVHFPFHGFHVDQFDGYWLI